MLCDWFTSDKVTNPDLHVHVVAPQTSHVYLLRVLIGSFCGMRLFNCDRLGFGFIITQLKTALKLVVTVHVHEDN